MLLTFPKDLCDLHQWTGLCVLLKILVLQKRFLKWNWHRGEQRKHTWKALHFNMASLSSLFRDNQYVSLDVFTKPKSIWAKDKLCLTVDQAYTFSRSTWHVLRKADMISQQMGISRPAFQFYCELVWRVKVLWRWLPEPCVQPSNGLLRILCISIAQHANLCR